MSPKGWPNLSQYNIIYKLKTNQYVKSEVFVILNRILPKQSWGYFYRSFHMVSMIMKKTDTHKSHRIGESVAGVGWISSPKKTDVSNEENSTPLAGVYRGIY